MSQIVNHYLYLLIQKDDCVIVPNFGAFIVNKVPSFIEGTTIYPAGLELNFNKKLDYNDGQLINFIREKEQVDYNKATEIVANYVQNILDLVTLQKVYEVPMMGCFKLDDHQFLNFEQLHPLPITRKDTFGLYPLKLNSLNIEVEKENEILLDSKKQVSKSRKRVLILASIIVLLTASTLGIIEIFRPNSQGHHMDSASFVSVPQSIKKVNPSTEVVSTPIKSSVASINSNKELKVEANIPITEIKTEELKKYKIVAGSFGIKSNADKLYLELSKKYQEAFILEDKNNQTYKVVIYESDSYADATQFRSDQKLNYWILK